MDLTTMLVWAWKINMILMVIWTCYGMNYMSKHHPDTWDTLNSMLDDWNEAHPRFPI